MLRSRLRNRRGNILVMVAFMLVALMAVTAIVLDIGRFYVLNNGLQTIMDASALAGAEHMQFSTTKNSATLQEEVRDHVVAFVAAEYPQIDNEAMSVLRDSVRLAYWDKGYTVPDFDWATNGRIPNAVAVGSFRNANTIFARVIGRSTQHLHKHAVAWVANINSSNCVRPWGLPYWALYNKVHGGNADSSATLPQLSQAEMVEFGKKSVNDRMIVIIAGNNTTTLPHHGAWKPFNYGGNAGAPDFKEGIYTCSHYQINTDAANGVTLPGNATGYQNYLMWAEQGNPSPVERLCHFKATGDAACYWEATSADIGRKTKVAWGDFFGRGSNEMKFRVIGEFEIYCYYQSSADNCGHGNPDLPTTGYPRGTVIGVAQGLSYGYITPTDELGASVGDLQRLVLVR